MGVTEAVGDEEDRDRGEEPALIVIREVEDAPSGADMSLLSSSLLLRDTEIALVESMLDTLWRADVGRAAAVPLRRCSAGMEISV